MRPWRGVWALERAQDSGKRCADPRRAQDLERMCDAPGTEWGPQERCEALERDPRGIMRPQVRCRALQSGVCPQRWRKAAGRVSSWGRVSSKGRVLL